MISLLFQNSSRESMLKLKSPIKYIIYCIAVTRNNKGIVTTNSINEQ